MRSGSGNNLRNCKNDNCLALMLALTLPRLVISNLPGILERERVVEFDRLDSAENIITRGSSWRQHVLIKMIKQLGLGLCVTDLIITLTVLVTVSLRVGVTERLKLATDHILISGLTKQVIITLLLLLVLLEGVPVDAPPLLRPAPRLLMTHATDIHPA